MSLQRVLETARKNGMPVIVTDLAGREPMVVMPLERFEAMAGDTKPQAPSRQEKPAQSVQDPVEQTLEEVTAQQLRNRMEESVIQNPEIPLEEGFYLEPVEDK